ncbi:KilA-N domain-containing protein [Methylocystis sp. L43]|uniref:KilA-N domain-containing protein n=1 Tax=unclassified Methylocystis TaxID=2625913 RepID=UPI0018C3493F|nr:MULTISPECIES: KilA-N domain-containing protein [unclassified Methylocystis]MBG0797156.1 KilA-N domain-containing protein [Methylocystis sp. L43]MBG0804973.1 KilA-N domain-containing protein [Methylocystis sp. H15]
MSGTALNFLTIKGRKIAVDEKGRIRLNDIHKAGGFSKNQLPTDWGSLPSTLSLVRITAEKSSGKSGTLSKDVILSVYCARNGKGGGVWAHPNLALAYAKYLSPALHYEVNEVFLRYKSGDATLADETLQRSTSEGNEWVARRAMSRVVRNEYTQELDARGVKKPLEFGVCTNETYINLFDKPAKQLKIERGLNPKTGKLRDKMSMKELAFVAASEALSVEHMEDVKAVGFSQCRKATANAAQSIRSAIETDRRNRQNKML